MSVILYLQVELHSFDHNECHYPMSLAIITSEDLGYQLNAYRSNDLGPFVSWPLDQEHMSLTGLGCDEI